MFNIILTKLDGTKFVPWKLLVMVCDVKVAGNTVECTWLFCITLCNG